MDDDTTVALLRQQDKVVYRSTWITDSSLSRTRQPLGAYALSESRLGTTSVFQSPLASVSQRPHTVHSERRTGRVQRSLSQIYSTPPAGRPFYSPPPMSATPSHLMSRRPRSVAGGDYYHAASADYYARLRESADDPQSIRSKSSRLSNASSVISNYGHRQHVVSRFIVHADSQTRASILADVSDFTPNAHGFVAYKIPKLTQ
ncbi:hypothetical protein H4S04_000170 [Coemansia sp. S16]|nr:hypothetical protein H4S04_000170 [Coemansia sp. S16]KAJ2067120.1 hypothetical protein GGI08_001536 [Coemansia sp. S2]